MYNKFIARQVQRPWQDIANDCFVFGLFAGCMLGGFILWEVQLYYGLIPIPARSVKTGHKAPES